MLDMDIVNAGNKGLRPGVVAIEYIDWGFSLNTRPVLLICLFVRLRSPS
jgi:hypothetical protein